jgi:hypothetical protein
MITNDELMAYRTHDEIHSLKLQVANLKSQVETYKRLLEEAEAREIEIRTAWAAEHAVEVSA